jgi:hypothetical protein
MDASLTTLQQAETAKHVPNSQKDAHQCGLIAQTAPLQIEQPKKNQKGIKQVNSQQSAQKGISKEFQPANSGKDRESSHRLNFLLQAAHLVRGLSSSLSR